MVKVAPILVILVLTMGSKDGNGLYSHGIGSGYHLLPHFNSNANTDLDTFKYKSKKMSQIWISIWIYTQVNSKCILLSLIYINKTLHR
jgi:hypothetical protein